jgi:ubiquinone/menaquinone biosynthesis C-methylase UbiE
MKARKPMPAKTRPAKPTTSETGGNKLDLRNEIQAVYARSGLPWFAWVFGALDLPPRCRILELGGGTGSLWAENAPSIPKGWQVVISDPALPMTRGARERLRAAKLPIRPRYAAIDAAHLPFPDSSFDAVLAVGVFDLVPDLFQALRETARVLAPSGQLIATAGGQGHLGELETLLRPLVPAQTAEMIGGVESRFGMENGASLLAPFFDEVRQQPYRDQLAFPEPQPVLDYILSEQAIAWSLTVQQVGEVVARVRQSIRKRGAFTVTLHKGIFIARKHSRR